MIEKKDPEGKTPLIRAALYGDVDAVRILLEQGANVKARDNFLRTPLIAATATWNGPMNCSVDIVRLLLAHGADINAQNKKGRTALMEALEKWQFARQREMVELLLSHKPDLTLKDKSGRTALAMASTSLAPLLRKAGAKA